MADDVCDVCGARGGGLSDDFGVHIFSIRANWD